MLTRLRDIVYARNNIHSPDILERRQKLLCSDSLRDRGVLLVRVLATGKVGRRVIRNFDEVVNWTKGVPFPLVRHPFF